MKLIILKKENGQETRMTPASLKEVRDIISVYGSDIRYLIQKGKQLIYVFTCPNNNYQVVHYDMDEDICTELTVPGESAGMVCCEVSYETMIHEVLHFLKHDNYRWGSEWEPVDTDELLDISSADLENLLETEDANYNRQKVFSNLHN